MVESTSSWGRNSWWSWTRPPEVAPLTAPHRTFIPHSCSADGTPGTKSNQMPSGRGSSRPLPRPSTLHWRFLGLFLPQSRPLPQAASPLRRRMGGRSPPPHLVLIHLNVLEPRGRGPGVGPIHGGDSRILFIPQRKRKHHRGIPPGRERAVQLPLGRLRTHRAVPSPLSSAR